MQADTGTKMLHIGKNTRSRIISKGISAGNSRNCYRGLVQVTSSALSNTCLKRNQRSRPRCSFIGLRIWGSLVPLFTLHSLL